MLSEQEKKELREMNSKMFAIQTSAYSNDCEECKRLKKRIEELEKEAKEYAEKHKMDMIDYHDSLFMEDAYLASAEPREKRIAELEAQIEKMKCGGNCKHLYHINTGGCFDAKCDLTYCDCINCKDKWELRG